MAYAAQSSSRCSSYRPDEPISKVVKGLGSLIAPVA